MYFSSHSSDKQYFSSQKIDENVVFLATTQDKSGLTRQELQCVVTRNETLSGYRNCIISLAVPFEVLYVWACEAFPSIHPECKVIVNQVAPNPIGEPD